MIAVVFNPSKAKNVAGARRRICRALRRQGFDEPLWYETTADEPGTAQTREAVAAGAELVLVSGGDGTVMACATALAGGEVPLGVLPNGTGNLLARNFGIPHKLKAAAAVAAGGTDRRIDVGVVGDQRFLIMAGMGFDAQMLDDAPDKLKAKVGWPAYVVAAARHLREPRHTFVLTLDDEQPTRHRGRGVLVANVGKLQGGLPVLPDAVPDDGLLDVAMIKPKSLVDWVLLATAVLLRRSDRRLETFQAARVVVECEDKLPTELDGEVVGGAARLEVSVLAGALLLRVPRA